MANKAKAGQTILFRYVITHILILIIPLAVSLAYYHVSKESQKKTINSIVQTQLNTDVSYIDRNLRNLNKQVDELLVDYELNRYLNMDSQISDIDLYNTQRFTSRLSSIILGGEFLSRGFIYMEKSGKVILDNGISDYSSFYGNLFDVRGFNRYGWKDFFRRQDSNNIIPNYFVSSGGTYQHSHFLIRQIGRDNFYRGSFVAVMNSSEIGRKLTQLPELYGGWIIVLDQKENLISCSGSLSQGRELIDRYKRYNLDSTITIEDSSYRMFSKLSSFNQWRYVAFMNEEAIHKDLMRIRNLSLLFLMGGFLISLFFSFILAYKNYRPLERLFHILGMSHNCSSFQYSNLCSELEKSAQDLYESKSRLSLAVDQANRTTQIYFLQNLIGGKYRSRANFRRDREQFNVPLKDQKYFIIVSSISPLALNQVSSQTAPMITALQQAVEKQLSHDELVLRIATGELALVIKLDDSIHFRNKADLLIEKIQQSLQKELKQHILFGVGSVMEDPYLLPLSYNEAEAAVHALREDYSRSCCYYEDLDTSCYFFQYPLHTEEALIRAVRSSNEEMIQSIEQRIIQMNFHERNLGIQEQENLILSLKGTALRLLNEFPRGMEKLRLSLNNIEDGRDPQSTSKEIFSSLITMSRIYDQGKQCRQSLISEKIRFYIDKNYEDFNLGVSSLSERFNLSENYLSSIFHEQQGEKLSCYIQKIRMREASCQLQNQPELSIERVSRNCGYPNTSSFRRAFKRLHGISPSDYRNQNRNPQ